MKRDWLRLLGVCAVAGGLALAGGVGCDSSGGQGDGTGGAGGTASDAGGDASPSIPEVPDDCVITEPTLSQLSEHYFTPSCALPSCHHSDTVAGGLDLSGTASENHARLVGVDAMGADKTLVVPGDPASSFLLQKVDGSLDAPAEGVLMPQGIQEPLDPACRITMLEAWIANGAENN